MEAATRICKGCRQALPETEEHFYRSKATKSGWYGKCKPCHQSNVKAWAGRNPEKRREQARKFRAAHLEKERERHRAAYRANPEKHRDSVRRSHQKHRESRLEYAARYKEENRDGLLAKGRERHQRRKIEKPFEYKEECARRRARKFGIPHERLDYAAIYERDAGICHLCQKSVPVGEDLVFDHVIDLCKGGAHHPDNIKVAHYQCNRKKQLDSQKGIPPPQFKKKIKKQ